MSRPEQNLQIAVARFLDVALRSPTTWTAIGHGGGGRVRGAILKAMGVKRGWPDLLVLHPQPLGKALGSLVLGIELKAPKGRRSADQVEIHQAMIVAGAHVGVCHTVDAVQNFLAMYGVPLHAGVLGGGIVQARAQADAAHFRGQIPTSTDPDYLERMASAAEAARSA